MQSSEVLLQISGFPTYQACSNCFRLARFSGIELVVRQNLSRDPKRAGCWSNSSGYDDHLGTARRLGMAGTRVRVECTYIKEG
jgi:hypothetical protein